MNQPTESRAWRPCPADAVARGGIAVAAIASFWSGLRGPFLYDDVGSVVDNPTIRRLWPIGAALNPPGGGYTVSGRPVLNFSLAVNHALGGLNPWGYHATNLLIHVCASLVLFAVLKRLIHRVGILGAEGRLLVPFTIALLWAVHPIQTESVTYVSQRAESLMGLFYLLTVYGFARFVDEGPSGVPPRGTSESGQRGCRCRARWGWFSVGVCLLGMGTKEVMVTAPVIVLLYDRTFVAGTFREALRVRWRYHAGLAATWVPLGFLVLRTGSRAGTAGFGSGVAWWAYALTQLRGVAHYLRLSVWPHPLVGDYGRILGGPRAELVCDGVVVAALVAATAWALFRKVPNPGTGVGAGRMLGFAGACFFLILAPSSSVVPVATEIIAEHRMYLPLAAVLAVIVAGGCSLLGRIGRPAWPFLGLLCLVAAPALALMTNRRDEVYQSAFAFWSDAALKVPENAGAHNNLGNTLAEQGRLDAAIAEYEAALRLVPEYSDANADLGNALVKKGLYAEALDHYRVALKARPDAAEVRYGYGLALMRSGDAAAALPEFERVVSLDPAHADAWAGMGDLLAGSSRWAEAAQAYAAATRLRPDNADAHVNFGNVLGQLGRGAEAIGQLETALRLQPGAADVHNNLGGLLAEAGRYAEARAQFEEALRIKPDYREARDNLGHVLQLEQAAAGR